jgi:hypothetical protein
MMEKLLAISTFPHNEVLKITFIIQEEFNLWLLELKVMTLNLPQNFSSGALLKASQLPF